jgi:hypothetical protein
MIRRRTTREESLRRKKREAKMTFKKGKNGAYVFT